MASTFEDLAAHVRAAPYDEERWLVLEDWVLENDPTRAEIIRLQKSGQLDASRTNEQLLPLAFGSRWKSIRDRLRVEDWRAGFLRACTIDVPANATGLFKAFASAPAVPLLRELEIKLEFCDFGDYHLLLQRAAFGPWLRSLTLHCEHRQTWAPGIIWFHYERIGRLAQVERLALRGHAPLLAPSPHLARLTHLEHTPTTNGELAALFRPRSFPCLQSLVLDVHRLELRPEDLGCVLSAEATPSLTELRISPVDRRTLSRLIDGLAKSELLQRLRTLSFGGTSTPPSSLGSAFEHLEVLEIPRNLLPKARASKIRARMSR